MTQEKTINELKEELDGILKKKEIKVERYSEEELVERMNVAKNVAERVFGAGVTQSTIISLFSAIGHFKN